MSKQIAMRTSALAGAGAAGLALIVGLQVSSSTAAITTQPSDTGYPSVGVVPAQVERDVQQFAIHIDPVASTPAQVAAASPAIPATAAVDTVKAALGLRPDAVPESMSLARVTTGSYGQELEADPTKPSRIDPAIHDRLTWVVTFTSAEMPVLGKEGYGGPTTVRGSLFALVDPATGKFLYSIGY